MATDDQKPDGLGEESPVCTHPDNSNQNHHFVVPLWTESLQSNGHYSTAGNESLKNMADVTQFPSTSENQVHFQPDFTGIRPQFETNCHIAPVTYSEVLNTEGSGISVLNVQGGGILSVQDNSVYTELPVVQNRGGPGSLTTTPSISECPNLVTFSYSKMMSGNSSEPIPLSYTELLSSVQNSTGNSGTFSETTAISSLGNTHSQTVSSVSETERVRYLENQPQDKDLNSSQIETVKGAEFVGTVLESQTGTNEVEYPSLSLVGKTNSMEESPGITQPVTHVMTEAEDIEVPVQLFQKKDEPPQKIISKSKKKKQDSDTETQKSVKRKLRQNKHNIKVIETNRGSPLRSGKKAEPKQSKRNRKRGLEETPVEYEIVKHEINVAQDESIETESYNDLLAELNSLKDEYIRLQNVLTDVETKYSVLLSSTTDKKIVKKEEDPEMFPTKLISTVASYFNKPLFSDIQVLLGEGHILHGHKLILAARSEYWGLQHLYYIDKLDLTGVRQEVGYEVIKWVYTDELDTKVDVSFILEILHASVKYKLDGLNKRCEKGLITLININNCENLKQVAEDLNCKELQEECQQFLDVHQIAPVSPLVEDDTEEVLDDLDYEDDSDFEPNVVFEEAKKDQKGGKKGKRLKGIKDKKRMTMRNKKKISSIVEKLHKKKLSEAVDVELGSKLANKLERLQMKARILAGEKPYQCEQCGRAFAAKGNLKRHISMHSDDKPFECKICRKGFKTNSEVKRHNIVHSGEKRFMCDICSMCFSAGSSLHRHMRIHRGEKPYQCEACGKSFRSSGDVTKHNLTHTGEKPYKCPVCGKPFSRTQHVKKHMGIHKRQLGLQFQENQYPDYVKVTQNE